MNSDAPPDPHAGSRIARLRAAGLGLENGALVPVDDGAFFRDDSELTSRKRKRRDAVALALRVLARFDHRPVAEMAAEAGLTAAAVYQAAARLADKLGIRWSLSTSAFQEASRRRAADHWRHRRKETAAAGLEPNATAGKSERHAKEPTKPCGLSTAGRRKGGAV